MTWQTPYDDPLLSTLLNASLHTMGCCILATVVACFLGGIAAILWGAADGLFESAIRTLTGLMDSLGPVLPALAVLSALQVKSEWVVAMVLGMMTWNVIAAFLHDEASALKGKPFIQAAVAIGASPARVLLKHLIPHISARLTPVILGMLAGYSSVYGALGFLGIAGDSRYSLGFMIYDAKSFVHQNPAYFFGALVSFLILILVPHGLMHLLIKRKFGY